MKGLKLALIKKKKIIKVKNIEIGRKPIIIAGPCSVENEKQIMESAKIVKKLGADMLRGGAFKPRSSPYSFQGLEEKGLKLLRKAGDKYNLPIVSELMDAKDIKYFDDVDIIQIGARNMQNFSLLKELAKINKPILLKRGLSGKIEEWLSSAEYILQGNPNVILCERGIRTFETLTRNTLDLNAVALLKTITGLPVIVDPTHGTGVKEIITPMSKAALAAGADGLLIEVHNNPKKALSDSDQQLNEAEFKELMDKIKKYK